MGGCIVGGRPPLQGQLRPKRMSVAPRRFVARIGYSASSPHKVLRPPSAGAAFRSSVRTHACLPTHLLPDSTLRLENAPEAEAVAEMQPHQLRVPAPRAVRLWAQKRSDLVSLTLKRRLPTLPRENRSTIGVSELNFSVRNGKRWNLTAIAT